MTKARSEQREQEEADLIIKGLITIGTGVTARTWALAGLAASHAGAPARRDVGPAIASVLRRLGSLGNATSPAIDGIISAQIEYGKDPFWVAHDPMCPSPAGPSCRHFSVIPEVRLVLVLVLQVLYGLNVPAVFLVLLVLLVLARSSRSLTQASLSKLVRPSHGRGRYVHMVSAPSIAASCARSSTGPHRTWRRTCLLRRRGKRTRPRLADPTAETCAVEFQIISQRGLASANHASSRQTGLQGTAPLHSHTADAIPLSSKPTHHCPQSKAS